MEMKPYQEGGQWDRSNKLMMKFGNGIHGMLFELLDASAYSFGDPISDTDAMSGGGTTAANRGGETLQFQVSTFTQYHHQRVKFKGMK